MLSKEEYKKELIRMWDSVRADYNPYKGANNCNGVNCGKCPIHSHCCAIDQDDIRIYNAIEIIEIVEKWSKEHPIITNSDKFKEMFGFEVAPTLFKCAGISCPDEFLCIGSDCKKCPHNGFWDREYKEPKREVE